MTVYGTQYFYRMISIIDLDILMISFHLRNQYYIFKILIKVGLGWVFVIYFIFTCARGG